MASKAPSYLRNGKELVSGIQKLAYRHPAYQIFQDWLEVSAITNGSPEMKLQKK